jgi:hypothetical protein
MKTVARVVVPYIFDVVNWTYVTKNQLMNWQNKPLGRVGRLRASIGCSSWVDTRTAVFMSAPGC